MKKRRQSFQAETKLIEQKRFYTKEKLRNIRIPRFAKIPTLYRDWPRSFK